MNRARLAIEAKCSRVTSESASIFTAYLRRMATPNSSASIESRPSPSPNNGTSLSICSTLRSSRLRTSINNCLSSCSRALSERDTPRKFLLEQERETPRRRVSRLPRAQKITSVYGTTHSHDQARLPVRRSVPGHSLREQRRLALEVDEPNRRF